MQCHLFRHLSEEIKTDYYFNTQVMGLEIAQVD